MVTEWADVALLIRQQARFVEEVPIPTRVEETGKEDGFRLRVKNPRANERPCGLYINSIKACQIAPS